MAKSSIQQEDYFHHQIGLGFREETNEVLHFEHSFIMLLKLGTFRKVDYK
jgi:hypothetical protein